MHLKARLRASAINNNSKESWLSIQSLEIERCSGEKRKAETFKESQDWVASNSARQKAHAGASPREDEIKAKT